jgi:phosphate:Na+ symporter
MAVAGSAIGRRYLLAPRHLDQDAIDTPSVALASAAREALRLGDTVETMLQRSIDAFSADDPALVKQIERLDEQVDSLHEAIKLYLTKLSQEELEPDESHRCVEILTFTTNFEHIGDIVDRNLMELAGKKIKAGLHFSEPGMAEIQALNGTVMETLRLTLTVFMHGDSVMARRLIAGKTDIGALEAAAMENHLDRVARRLPDTLATSSLHLDVIRDLKRIHSHIAAVAYPILDRAGELRPSRLRAPEPPASPEPAPHH